MRATTTGRSRDDTVAATQYRGGGGASLADPELLGPRMRRRRAFILILMTLVAPGSAQLVAGDRRLGRLGLRVWLTALGLVLVAGLVSLFRRSWLLALFSRSSMLFVLAIVLALLALLWLVLFIDTVRLTRLRSTPPRTRVLVGALTAVLLLVTTGTLGVAAVDVWAGRSAVLDIFGSKVSRPPVDGRYNVLLLGGDSGASRVGTRPDTIMLASVNADSGRTVLFGFARNTENINFRPGSTMSQLMPEGWNCGDQCLLNGLYMWAVEHRDRFPADVQDPGALATKEAVEALSGLDIQYYALVDLKGFRRLIDALGGLDINVGKRTPIGGGTSPITGWIEPGRQHLDGYHSLWYARSRTGSSDYERMARQKCVINAISRQLNPQTVILKFQDIAAVSGSVLQTDVPESDLGGLADLALKSRSQKTRSVSFVPPLINPARYDAWEVRDIVRNSIRTSESDESTSSRREDPGATDGSRPGGSRTDGTGSGGTSGSGGTTGQGEPGSGGGTGETDLDQVCSPA